MSRYGVIAAFDGSASDEAALRWAAAEAMARGEPLTVCRAVPPSSRGPGHDEEAAAGGSGVLADAMRLTSQFAARLNVRILIRPGAAADVLLQAADEGDLLVLGAGGAGGRSGLGSVSTHVTAHARVPVIVVRGDGGWHGGRVIAGIDDSPAAEAAAGFAFEEAALRQVPLTVVMSCWVPPVPISGSYVDLASAAGHRRRGSAETYAEEMTRIGESRLDQVLGRWQGKYVDVVANVSLVTGPPHEALCEAARGAGLLVVGCRGLGPVRRMLLGSVSQAVLHHAPCPVAIVRPSG